MQKYLADSYFIDWTSPNILSQARDLSNGQYEQCEVAKSCFEFVRDIIKHSGDYALNPVTCKASDVLEHRTGYCYAKSHLLVPCFEPMKFQPISASND